MYATGFHSTAGVAVVTAEEAWFFTDSRYAEAAYKQIAGAEVMLVDREETYSRRINKIILDHDIKVLGFEDGRLTYSEYMEWSTSLNAALLPSQKLLTDLRAVKSRKTWTA